MNTTRPTQRTVIGGINNKPATQIDDLHWELQNLCNALNLKLEPTTEGVEVHTTNNQMFNADVVAKFDCETQSFTDHFLVVSSQTDADRYSASRFAKNLRNAIKMLRSDQTITVACDDAHCDYCN